MSSFLSLERQQKVFLNPFRIRILLFLSYPSGIETTNTFIHSRREPYPNSEVYTPVLDQNGAKTIPFKAAYTYMTNVRENC